MRQTLSWRILIWPWRRVLREKSIMLQKPKQIPAIYITWNLISVFTSANIWKDIGNVRTLNIQPRTPTEVRRPCYGWSWSSIILATVSSRTKEIKISLKVFEYLRVLSFKVFQQAKAILNFLSLWEQLQLFLLIWIFNCVIYGRSQLLSLYRIGERWTCEDGSFLEWYWPVKYPST